MVDQHFTIAAEHSDWSWTVGAGNLRMHNHGEGVGRYSMGEFMDPRGIVSVYRQKGHTRLDYVLTGRCYSRSWRRYLGDRTISRLARAFITDMHS